MIRLIQASLTCCPLLVAIIPASVAVAEERTVVAPAAAAAFEKHLANGTPLDGRAWEKNGWKRDYALLMRDRWKGHAEEGVTLSLASLPGHTYRVGEAFDCVASLEFDGDEPRLLDTGGNCGMTDALTLMVLSTADGQVRGCWGKVGGPHCFCKPKRELIRKGEAVRIETGFETDAAVGWVPDKPGEYVVVGWYALPSRKRPGKTVSSPPLVITVRTANE